MRTEDSVWLKKGDAASGKALTESHICVIAAYIVQNEDDETNRISDGNRHDGCVGGSADDHARSAAPRSDARQSSSGDANLAERGGTGDGDAERNCDSEGSGDFAGD